jgi:hypothetical protein
MAEGIELLQWVDVRALLEQREVGASRPSNDRLKLAGQSGGIDRLSQPCRNPSQRRSALVPVMSRDGRLLADPEPLSGIFERKLEHRIVLQPRPFGGEPCAFIGSEGGQQWIEALA